MNDLLRATQKDKFQTCGVITDVSIVRPTTKDGVYWQVIHIIDPTCDLKYKDSDDPCDWGAKYSKIEVSKETKVRVNVFSGKAKWFAKVIAFGDILFLKVSWRYLDSCLY